MLKKISFFITVLICLLITINIVGELSLDKHQIEPSSYFDQRDSTVYVVNHPSRVDFNTDKIHTLDCNSDLFQSISKSIPENCSVYMSQLRGLIVFEGHSNWNKASIKELFIDGKQKVEFTQLRHFKYGQFNGFYSKNKLILHTKDTSPKKCSNGFLIDKKANYCTVSFEKNKPLVRDYYKTKGKTICYKTNHGKSAGYKNINDKDLYSHFVSDDFENYTFYEKEYLANTDPSYYKSPLYNLTSTGILILHKNGNSLAIIDLKNGQNCTENLNEISNSENATGNYTYYPKLTCSNLIGDRMEGGYYVVDIDGFAIISKSKFFFDQISTEIKLGNVLLKNKLKMDKIYQNLPQKVLFREVNKTVEKTITKVGNTMVETNILNNNSLPNEPDSKSKDYFAMNPSEKIESFYAYSGRGNTFLITESNKWIRYENGVSKWEKTFEKNAVKEPKLMEMSSEEYQDISILFEDESLIVDKAGRILNRFKTSGRVHPIRLRLKNKVSFLIPNTNKMEVVDYDGKVLSTYSFSSEILDMVLFKENGKKHVGVLCAKTFFIINLDRKKTSRKIPLDERYTLHKFSEKSFIMNANETSIINILGEKVNCSIPNGFKLKSVFKENNVIHLLFSKDNEILALNEQGQFQWKKSISCSSIDKIFVHQTIMANNLPVIILGILDGIENKILILDSQGLSMDNVKRHGEKDLQITTYGNQGISITTFLGNYLIQYVKF